jgi:hypothetical protein
MWANPLKEGFLMKKGAVSLRFEHKQKKALFGRGHFASGRSNEAISLIGG